jgi:hypothetical protein
MSNSQNNDAYNTIKKLVGQCEKNNQQPNITIKDVNSDKISSSTVTLKSFDKDARESAKKKSIRDALTFIMNKNGYAPAEILQVLADMIVEGNKKSDKHCNCNHEESKKECSCCSSSDISDSIFHVKHEYKPDLHKKEQSQEYANRIALHKNILIHLYGRSFFE